MSKLDSSNREENKTVRYLRAKIAELDEVCKKCTAGECHIFCEIKLQKEKLINLLCERGRHSRT